MNCYTHCITLVVSIFGQFLGDLIHQISLFPREREREFLPRCQYRNKSHIFLIPSSFLVAKFIISLFIFFYIKLSSSFLFTLFTRFMKFHLPFFIVLDYILFTRYAFFHHPCFLLVLHPVFYLNIPLPLYQRHFASLDLFCPLLHIYGDVIKRKVLLNACYWKIPGKNVLKILRGNSREM